MIYREPYGVALIIGPFNGPLLLLIRPALAALAAGNTCILTLSEALPATTEVLLDLVPKYFHPSAVTAVPGGKETNTELLKLPNDFIFFTGSTFVGKIIARAAAETLTPLLLELGGMNPAVVDETANIPDAAKKIVGARWPGAANGAPRQATLMSTSLSPTLSSPRPRRRWSNSSAMIPSATPIIHASSMRKRLPGLHRSSIPPR
jgi:Aldehyde dehydrogenase family